MEKLSVVEENSIGKPERQFKPAKILLGSTPVINIHKYFWKDNAQAGKEEFFSTSWQTNIYPKLGLSLIRKIYTELDNTYRADGRVTNPADTKVDTDLLLIPKGNLGIEAFLDESQFASLLNPNINIVRIETPFCDFLFDIQDWTGSGRKVGVISHLNISQAIAKLAAKTSIRLLPYQSELAEKYNQILSRYPVPEKRG